MNNPTNDNQSEQPANNSIVKNDTNQSSKQDKKVPVIRLALSFIALLIAGYCYFISENYWVARIIFLIIILVNYLEQKREYDLETAKSEKSENK